MRALTRSLLPALTLAACATVPIAPAAPRAATPVAAPFERTWNGVIDVFSARNIPIRNIEKASGLIVAEPQRIPPTLKVAKEWADCGTVLGMALMPTSATYNVLVRGDTARSTVKVTVQWLRVGAPRGGLDPSEVEEECATKGIWESGFEKAVKALAESPKATP